MNNIYLLSHSVHSCILPLPLLSVCIVDVLSSDFLYGTALSVLTYTLITQTARNPLLAPLPHQLFSSLFVCVYVSVCMCLFGRTSLYTRLSWIKTVEVCCRRNGVALSGFARTGACFWEFEKITHSRLFWIRTEVLSRIVWTVLRGLSSGLVTSTAGGKIWTGCRSSWSAYKVKME